METVETGGTEPKKSSISRRNALKAGVATGVGAAAFAGPQIGMLGTAPAYAQTCSKPIVTSEFAGGSINNGSSCGGSAEMNATINGTINGITAVATNTCVGNGNMVTITNAAGGFCVATITVQRPNGTPCADTNGDPIVVSSGQFNSGDTIPMPPLADGQCPAGNVFLTVTCSEDSDCV